MTVNSPEFVRDYANRMAPLSHRQMPVFSQVGKGLRGDNAQIELHEDGINSYLRGVYYNQMTEDTEELWQLPLLNIVPRLHYEVWEGVEEFDGTAMSYYYIIFKYSITMYDQTVELWNMTTPHVYTHPFYGTTIPAESKIEEN